MRDLLDEAATQHPAQTAILATNKRYNYKELREAVHATAGRLRELGVAPGDVIALSLPQPTIAYIVLLLAIIQSRALACPLATTLPSEVIETRLRQIGARWLLTSESCTRSDVKVLFWKEVLREEGPAFADPAFAGQGPTEDMPAVIVFTSGSSADPKAAVLSFGNLIHSAEASNHNITVQPGDRWLLSLPLHHVSGLGIVFRCLTSGGTICIASWNAIPDVLEVTHVSLVPRQLHWFMQEPSRTQALQHLKAVLLGGGAIAPSLIRYAVAQSLHIFTSYGLTEMASQVTTTQPGDPLEALLTSGMPLDPGTIRLSDDNEIMVRGNRLFLGYLESDSLSLPLSEDGWFHTRDTGYFNTAGRLVVTGRKDNMFVCGGENVQPEAVEHSLLNTAGVVQACVVPVWDEALGHIGVAFVRMRAGNPWHPEALHATLRENLSTHQIPKHFLPWPEDLAEEGIKVARRRLTTLAQQLIGSNWNI